MPEYQPNVAFVAPYFLDTTIRFIEAASELPNVRLGLVSSDPEEKLPGPLRARLAAHHRLENCLDPPQILSAMGALAKRLGSVDRLLGTLEELQVPLGQVRDRLGLPGMGAEAAKNFRDKARMKTVLQDHGVPCARHRLVGHATEAWSFASDIGYPMVVKPPAGAGARNTFRVEGPEQLRHVLSVSSFSPERPALFEEFILGQEHSFDSVFIHGQPVWFSINHYFPGPLEVLENPWIQWCVLLPREVTHPQYDEIRSVAFRALEVLGMKDGLSHMEWFRRKDGTVAISEVGARPPGAQFTTLMSYAHDLDMYRAWARLMVYDDFPAPPRRFAAGAAYLRGQGQGKVRAIHGLEEVRRELGHLVVEAKLPQVGQPQSSSYEGEGYVILRHPETHVVEDGLRRLITTIRIELG